MDFRYLYIIALFITGMVIILYYASHQLSNISKKLYNNNVYVYYKHPFINFVKLTSQPHSFYKGILRTSERPLIIYLYNECDYISQIIIKHKKIEWAFHRQFEYFIKRNPGIQVLDAGCNLGMFTLSAAFFGCRVVSLDSNSANTDRLVQSLVANKLTSTVTVCLNILSNDRREFQLTTEKNYIGKPIDLENITKNRLIKGIIMEDLISLFEKNRPIFMKLDIQGQEINVFENASTFFEEFDVKAVMFQWETIRYMENVKALLKFFTKRNYVPYSQFVKINILDLSKYETWPDKVIWFKV